MADFLDTTFMVNFLRETPAESYKLMNSKQKIIATAYEGGERTLQSGDAEVKLVDNVTHFYLISEKPVTISFSDGKIFEGMQQFVYASDNKISVAVSNPGNLTTKVTYAAGLKSD